jgi:hypothetical protein
VRESWSVLRVLKAARQETSSISGGGPTATTVLGLDGFAVWVVEVIDSEVWMAVQTTADVVGCPVCGCRARGNGRRRVRIRDLPAGGRPVVLV